MNWILEPEQYTTNGLNIGGCSIVEYWEKPIQEILAKSVYNGEQDSILEIGYGLGFASQFISNLPFAIHLLVEAHPSIAKNAKKELSDKSSVIVSFWQDIIKFLKANTFDGIIFDAYPVENIQYDGTKESTLKFVSDFLIEASPLLKICGKLVFLDFSCEVHLLEKFNQIVNANFTKFEVVTVNIDIPVNCTYAKNNIGNVIILIK